MSGAAYRGALLRMVVKRPGFRANDYSIWLFKEHGLAIPTPTVLSALKQMAKQDMVRREDEPGPPGVNAPTIWQPIV